MRSGTFIQCNYVRSGVIRSYFDAKKHKPSSRINTDCIRLVSPPPLHLTTSKVMVIVWRLRGNIIWTVLYWQRATSSMGTVNRNSSHSPIGPWVCLYLGQLSHFLSCFGTGVTNLNEPPSSFLLPPHYCGLGAGSIPFRAVVNNKQCEMRGLFMSLVIHYWIGDVQDCQGVSASEMTYIVLSGALNSNHSLTHSLAYLTNNTVSTTRKRLGYSWIG